ncbi:hypothetical protein TEA_024404 [Camellia sinensis var. sinensis]|uniref:Uncharacterized protein n=1 Tax=Camellia sinensis var. sinensis TaxID=542762 RepID=A0A4V3WJ73_CAMSN|nr:hypothetical protein TEA_024404 [Camellia sinensis var. sinensis]
MNDGPVLPLKSNVLDEIVKHLRLVILINLLNQSSIPEEAAEEDRTPAALVSWIGGDPGPGPFSSSLGGLGFKRWIGQLWSKIEEPEIKLSNYFLSPNGLYHRMGDKDKKIEALTRELQRQDQLCAAYREKLLKFLANVEQEAEQLSSKIQLIVDNVRKVEAEVQKLSQRIIQPCHTAIISGGSNGVVAALVEIGEFFETDEAIDVSVELPLRCVGLESFHD